MKVRKNFCPTRKYHWSIFRLTQMESSLSHCNIFWPSVIFCIPWAIAWAIAFFDVNNKFILGRFKLNYHRMIVRFRVGIDSFWSKFIMKSTKMEKMRRNIVFKALLRHKNYFESLGCFESELPTEHIARIFWKEQWRSISYAFYNMCWFSLWSFGVLWTLSNMLHR